MNLLTEPWLPVRKRDGTREWIGPSRLSDPDIVAFDADRADFNGALAQFAIGLLQTTTPVDSPMEWRRLFNNPPDGVTLQSWFAPVISAFEFNGNGARFMQDLSLKPEDGSTCEIGALFIEAPGENALKNNRDHFIKRAGVSATCPHCTAAALFTMQVNAPAGGAGHRTGLRGGGPLTTLLLSKDTAALWQDLWLNVRERRAFLAHAGDPKKEAKHSTFPWLADISAIQRDGGETTPVQVHPAHVYWAMPRRIRLNFDASRSGTCDICGRDSQQLLSEYVTRNYGLNYKGAWDHPLSPYYEAKEGWLPFHPQPGGIGYRHWLPWVLGLSSDRKKQRSARVVDHFLRERMRVVPGALRLWAFGYDMDNMKARCWYESLLPLYALADCAPDAQKNVESEVANWLAAAELAASFLRGAVKDAWFSGDARGDLSAVDAAFWNGTQPQFYAQLKRLIEAARDGTPTDPLPGREAWLKHLAIAAMKLFDDDFVGTGPVERENPKRVAAAFQQLKRSLYGSKMRQALGLPDNEEIKSKRRDRKSVV